jgi:cytoskeleton protein RodZ
MKVRIGNVAGTQVIFRGQPYELARSRDNVARFELK